LKQALVGIVIFAASACSGPEKGADRYFVGGSPDAGGDGSTAACGGVVCDVNATCVESGGTAKCACKSGYSGDGATCQDVDECADPAKHECGTNANCVNRPGGWGCECKPGFAGDATKACTGVDECNGITNTCDPNAACADANPGFTCTCKTGFSGDGFGCGDVNECSDSSKYSCAANARCVNSFGSYGCECLAGFAGEGSTSCKTLCEIAGADRAQCAAEGLCRVDGRGAVCDACKPGFRGNGVSCEKVSCQSQCDGAAPDAANAICLTDGSCACAPGYQGTVGSCSDIDECAQANGGCGEHATCTNAPGGHLCACQPGYARDSSGNCSDVDECAKTPGPCHPDAACTNQAPGFTCACKDGFTGDGAVCKDVDECKATANGGCPAGSTCVNERGGKRCECAPPLVGSADNCHCDLTGVWAMRQDLDTCWPARPIQEGTQQNIVSAGSIEASVWDLYELTYDGDTLSLRGKGCGADDEPDLISPLFRETYSAFIPYSVTKKAEPGGAVPFSIRGLAPGVSFKTPSFAGVSGMKLTDPLNDPWPASNAVPPELWDDSDGDGELGMTLWPHVPSETTNSGSGHYSYLPARPAVGGGAAGFYIDERAGCVSLALRVIGHFEADVQSCTRITGAVVNERTEGRVKSCTMVEKGTCNPSNPNDCTGWHKDVTCNASDWASARRCGPEEIARLDDDQNQKQDTKSTFELVRMGDKGMPFTCDDVRTKLPAIVRAQPTITCKTPE